MVVGIEPQIAFVVEPRESGLDVLVNFGLLAGREATPAEIDELARLLRPDVHEVTIVSETRHEIGLSAEGEVYLVRISVDDSFDGLAERIVDTASFWARMCDADRHAPF